MKSTEVFDTMTALFKANKTTQAKLLATIKKMSDDGDAEIKKKAEDFYKVAGIEVKKSSSKEDQSINKIVAYLSKCDIKKLQIISKVVKAHL